MAKSWLREPALIHSLYFPDNCKSFEPVPEELWAIEVDQCFVRLYGETDWMAFSCQQHGRPILI